MDNKVNSLQRNMRITQSQEQREQVLPLSDIQPREISCEIHYDPNEYLGRSQLIHPRCKTEKQYYGIQNNKSDNGINTLSSTSRILDEKTLEAEKFNSKQEIEDFLAAYKDKYKYDSGIFSKSKINELVEIINEHPEMGGYVKLWAADKDIKPKDFTKLIYNYKFFPQELIKLLGMKNLDDTYRFTIKDIIYSNFVETLHDYPEITEYYLNLKNPDGNSFLTKPYDISYMVHSSKINSDYSKIIDKYRQPDGSFLDVNTYDMMISSGYSADFVDKLHKITNENSDIFDALFELENLDKLSDEELSLVVSDLKIQKKNNNTDWKNDITARLDNNIYQKISEIINENTPGAQLITLHKDNYHKDAITFTSAIVDKTLTTEFTISKKGKLLRKETQIPNKKPMPKIHTRTNTKSSIVDYTYSNFYDGSTKVVKDKDGNVLFKERYQKSQVPYRYNIYRTENGKEYIAGLAEKTPAGDTVVEKTIISPDGTKNDCVYGQDADGSRFTYNKITDSDGNVLLDNHRKLKVIDEDHIQSTENGVVYDMKFDFFNGKLTVSQMNGDNVVDTVTHEFGEENDQIAPELYPVMKQLPGSLFFQMRDLHFNQMCFVKDESLKNNAIYDGYSNIGISPEQAKQDGAFTILHEFGHFLDDKYNLCKDNDLLKIFEQEKSDFLKITSNKELSNMKYFVDELHKNKDGAITEVIAETYALMNILTTDPEIILRGEYLQQYFPKTMAYIANKLERN